MSIACFKDITVTVKVPGPCVTPSLKSWTTAAVSGKSFDMTGHSGFLPVDQAKVQTATNKLWVTPSANDGTWLIDTFDISGATPITAVGIGPVDVGGFPEVIDLALVPAINKAVLWRQHWNGASYDLWLTFMDATTGVESSHIAGLSTETNRSSFCLVERTDLTHHYVAFLNGNAGTHMKVFLIDVDAESIVTSTDLGTTLAGGICYSCDRDSFFVAQFTNLLELDRATLALKNTYVGNATNTVMIDYVKTTQEVWGVEANNTTVDITNVKTGALSSMTLAEGFSGFAAGFPYGGRFYHETLNAFCIGGTATGFSGNPPFYYVYDVATRTLKAQVDCSAQITAFCSWDWWAQGFNLSAGSIYVTSGCWTTPPNYGMFEIAAS